MKALMLLPLVALLSRPAQAQEIPAGYAGILQSLGRQGDYKDAVLKVNIPRNDVKVVVDGIATPTPFGFGGWIAEHLASRQVPSTRSPSADPTSRWKKWAPRSMHGWA
jgi:hypothetical protein